ncbi:2-dehydro-3-deoxygalactonokinase [Niveibacterium microcysteis]|uniref:2-dehydro-3-deoxygalactonokinase n=1 Tax=Niveibacterium microcysteis TaxID=2811415 RepID=A0ABX7M9S7_9RHOO|nr:2-dehydro-3-deoxygalactonokinase [Niveibacterium microcysteis]QSI78500.1 2-dehydro-3-deoxygalactonokinase [Niveibacterium microcysteis]
MNVLTIDTGTTNTRVTVWRDGAVLHRAARQVGVRDTAISGSSEILKAGVRDTIADALQGAGIGIDAVTRVIASGMISSELGLRQVPHVDVPAGRDVLAAAMASARIPEVCRKTLWFVPGVRNVAADLGLHNCEAMDMMRGEETETMGLIDRVGIAAPAVVVLPGSHSKFVHLDAQQQVIGCVTTLAGELLHVLTHNTILAGSLESGFADSIDAEMLLAGARAARDIGLGRAGFVVRILDQFTVYGRNARANYLLGAVLAADLMTLKNSSAVRMSPGTQFVITGKPLLREALALLVAGDDFFSGRVTVTSDIEQADLAGWGALCIARVRGLVPEAFFPQPAAVATRRKPARAKVPA